MPQADLDRAIEHYRELAPRYDRATRLINRIRERAIDALQLGPGDTVLDAGCGTGWCLPRIAARIGKGGCIIGFDPSPEMLAVASNRLEGANSPRLQLLCANAERVAMPEPADAVLFSFTHDLIRSRAALDNVLGQVKPGARIAATGTKLYTPWLVPANWFVRYRHRQYITNPEGLEAPWTLLAEYLDDLRVDTGPFTQLYVASGRNRG